MSDLAHLSREELERSRFFLDSLIEHLPNMIFVKDARELRFVHFNREGEKLLGLSRDSLIGKNDYDLFPKEQADFFTSKDRAVLESGELLDIPEEPITTQNGLRFLHTRKIPLKNRDGKIEYLLGISEDITQRKISEEELRASQEALRLSHAELENRVLERTAQLKEAVEARDEFISIASHELKTPLTPLKLQLQSLCKSMARHPGSVPQSPHVARLLESSDRQITRLTHLIDDLLDVSRISQGQLSLHREPLELGQLVRETAERHADQLRHAHASIVIETPHPVQGQLDRLRIEQVLTNLLTNAIKYAPGGPILIKVRQEGDWAALSVQDQGAGIPPEQFARLFQRFERGSTHLGIGGLGLGLYISRRIVEAHGGTITADTQADATTAGAQGGATAAGALSRAGARFTVRLPLSGP